MTRQDKTRQDKTRQDKTRQDKTRQDKIRPVSSARTVHLPEGVRRTQKTLDKGID